MALVTNITQKVEIPHEPGEALVLRRLTWKQLEAARRTAATTQREDMKALGAEFVGAIMRAGSDTDRDAAKARLEAFQYDVSQFDREALLKMGISAWSYEADVTDETRDALDEETAAFAAQEIVRISRPKTAADTKNS